MVGRISEHGHVGSHYTGVLPGDAGHEVMVATGGGQKGEGWGEADGDYYQDMVDRLHHGRTWLDWFCFGYSQC